MNRTLAGAFVALWLVAFTPPSLAFSPGETTACKTGEGPDYLRGRYQWYVSRYGIGGVFDPQKRLEQVREAYEEYLRSARPKAAAGRDALTPISPGAFHLVGPVNGAGRMIAVEAHPTDPNVVYVGAAGGGCWKSTDGGASWRPLTDGLADLSVGAVALAPSNPLIVYLGTGEGGYGPDFIPGIGVLRSTDGGETWRLPPTVVSPMVYRISVDPRNPDNVLAFCGGDNAGIFRSTDGAATFTPVTPPSWGDAADVVRDPTKPDVLHATFFLPASRVGESAPYARSTDNGLTWTQNASGLPVGVARSSIAISSSGAVLYEMFAGLNWALLGVFRSTDGGAHWEKRLGAAPNIFDVGGEFGSQGGYDNALAVDPDDPNVLLLGGAAAGGTGHFRSTDGALTVAPVGAEENVHVDVHHLVFKRFGSVKLAWTANDGGVWRSTDGGVHWDDRNAGLATRQYYSVSIDPTRRNIFFAGSQDNGTDRIDAATGTATQVLGGDGFEGAVNTDDPSIVYASLLGTELYRSLSWGEPGSFALLNIPFTPDDLGFPFNSWITLDPNAPSTVYTGTDRVWRSEDGGDRWTPLASAAFAEFDATWALAVAKGRPDRLLTTEIRNGRVLLSDDRGATFTNLQDASRGLPRGLVSNVEIDSGNPDVFFVAMSYGSSGTLTDRLFKSTNGGATWSRADSGLPTFGVEVVRVDPGDSRTVYAGTLVGLYRSQDGGDTWARWGDGLPAAAIHEIRIAPDGSRVAVATHGRGIWAAEGLIANRAPVVTITSPASPTTIAVGGRVELAGGAVDPDGDPLTLRWELGDGLTAAGPEPGGVTYLVPGLHHVALIAEDAKGARSAAVVTVTVVPPNDACADATPIALLPDVTVVAGNGNAGAAAVDPSDPVTCSNGSVNNTLWFTLTPPADGSLDLDTIGSGGDTVMALYAGSCSDLGTALDCNDDLPGKTGAPSQLKTLAVTRNTTYRLLVGSWATAGHQGSPSQPTNVRALFKPAASDSSTAGASAMLPVVLDAFGKGGVRFVSDLVMLNRGTGPLTLSLTYGGPVGASGETTASLVIPAGAQIRAPDALAALRQMGVPVGRATASTSQVGSLSALAVQGDSSSLLLASRTASPNPNGVVGGSFGLFLSGTPFADAADGETVYVFGLRQTERDRSNLAVVAVPTSHPRSQGDASITLKIEVFDAAGNPAPTAIPDVTLNPGEWRQINEVLSAAGLGTAESDGGYARILKVSGSGRFLAYGVVNDQGTADGSLIPMTKAGDLTAGGTVLVPIVLEASGAKGSFFTSEVVLANRSTRNGSVQLHYVAAPSFGGVGSGDVVLPLAAGQQKVIPDFLRFLRTNGAAIPAGSAQGGALFVTFSGFDPADTVFAGVRTSTPNPDGAQGGSFGSFSAGVGPGALSSSAATVMALRQDADARSNLAAINTGSEPITLSVSLRRSSNGAQLGNALSRTLAPGEWYQWSNVFGAAGVSGGEGYAVLTRVSGTAPWFAYGVLNDAATSDGSVIAAAR